MAARSECRDVMNRANNFDLLRLLFASLVVVSHTNYLSNANIHFPLFRLSEIAVDGFFLITGYLISGSAEKSAHIRSYAIRRIGRIYPAYLAVLLIQAGVLFALSTRPVALSEVGRYLAVNAMFLNWLQPSLGNAIGAGAAINGSLWTLKIEVTFYALAPFLVVLTRRRGKSILLVLFAASIIFNMGASVIGFDKLAKQAPGMLYLFVLGIMLRGRHDTSGISAWWWALAAALFAGIATLEHADDVSGERWHAWYHVGRIALLTGFVYVAALKVPPIRIPLDISYGVYLWHYPIIQILLFFGFALLPFPKLLIIVSSLTLIVGLASAMTVERYGIRGGQALRRWLERRDQHATIGTPRQS